MISSNRGDHLNDTDILPAESKICRQEAMRVKPVASTGTSRLTKRNMQLAGFHIPAGTLILCPFDAVHHNELNWEEADTFKPVRLAH